MTFVDVFKHVSEKRRNIIPFSHFLKDKHFVEETRKTRNYHLQLDRDCDLTFKSTIRQVLFVWILIVIDNAHHGKPWLFVPIFQLFHTIQDLSFLLLVFLIYGAWAGLCDVNITDKIPELNGQFCDTLSFSKVLKHLVDNDLPVN